MKTLQVLAMTLISVFAPAKAVLITVMALSLVDLVLGIAASRVKGKKVSSRGLRKTVLKIMLYEIMVLCAYIVGKELVGPTIPVMNMATTLIGLTELKSIVENLSIIQGKDERSLFKTLVSKIDDLTSGDNKP